MSRSRALKVWLGCVLLQAGATGLILNCYTVFHAPLAEELALNNASVSLITTIRMIALSLGMLTGTRLYPRLGFRRLLALASLVQAAGFGLQSLFTALPPFLIVSVFIGYASGCLVTIPATIMVNNWFRQRQGLFLGIALAASGIMGALCSPLCSLLIGALGWRLSMIVVASAALLIDEIAAIGLCRKAPESETEMYGSAQELKVQPGGSNGTPLMLALAVALMIIVMATQQLTSHFTLYAAQSGLSLTAGALLNTACMIGNTSGKVIIGWLKDRIGSYRTVSLTLLLIALALAGLACGRLISLCAGIVGASYALGAIIPSFLAREQFNDRYESTTSLLSGAGTLVGSLSGYLIGHLSDLLQGYGPVFLGFALLCAFGQLLIYLLSKGGK